MLKAGRRFYNACFFNRKLEVDELTELFKRPPILSVLLGPPSSGKTALVKKVVEQVNHGGPLFHPLQMDLRGTSASSPDALYRCLYRSSQTFFKSILEKMLPSQMEFKVFASCSDF